MHNTAPPALAPSGAQPLSTTGGTKGLDPPTTEKSPVGPSSTSLASITLLAASALTVMSGALIAPALPSIAKAFSNEPGVELGARLMLTLPALGVALAGPVAGLVADRFGRLPLLLGALVAYAAAGSTGLYLDDLRALQVGRFGLGVAVAGVMTAATTFIADRWQGPARTRFLGIQAAAMGMGGLVFLVGGGALADLHWRAPFGMYLMSLLLIAPALMSLRAVRQPVGGLAVVPPVGANGGADAPPAPVLALYAAGLGGFALYYLIPTQVPFSLGARLNAGAFQVGLVVGLNTLFSAMASLSCGRLVRRFGAPRVLALAFGWMGIGFALLAPDAGWAPVLAAMVALGAGGGLLVPNLASWLTASAPPDRRGRVVGGLTTAVFAGQFISPLVVQPLRASQGLHGATGVFAAAAALAVGIGLVLWVRARR